MNLLLDIGGSVTRIATGDDMGDLSTPILFPTPKNPKEALRAIAEAGIKLLGNSKVQRIVVGVAGVVKDGVVVQSPNLPEWNGYSLQNELEKTFNAHALVRNDALLGALGEAHHGALQGAGTLLYVTFGTGIGAARIIDGAPDETIGTEMGHHYLLVDGTLIDAEAYISGTAIRAETGKPAEKLKDAKQWQEYSKRAALVVHNFAIHFVPDRIMLGGALMSEGALSLSVIEEELKRIGTHLHPVPTLSRSTLGALCGIHGADIFARRFSK